ncbi:thioredoxin domain-containing protein 16 isoform X2 [Brienomyrus brachyistius]|uniref:thioredoxin domain-containing protein 16 isoform X2 n=1 Tax=Brienomyrus brachyistius TaxID=42636 RepID=UPI0020B211FE|nr:thioredoxin domain-containing protein 16 isoform X2 [Brienomyrus brachyistius]
MAWYVCLVLSLGLHLKPCTTVNASKLKELTRESFLRIMQSGKTSFVYFGNHVTPTIGLFLEQLEKSADALDDYGILVAKVNCSEIPVPKYCTKELVMKKAYLFRGSELMKSFVTDTVFDVSAIVAHVLFTVLFNELRNVQTPEELWSIEKNVKGKADIVLAQIATLGLPEHRAVMEAAFVYGARYQFVLTAGGSVIKYLGVEDSSPPQSRLWFLHCKEVLQQSDPCPHTVMRRALTTLNIYTFLQLMEAPLVTEVSADPSEVKLPYSHLHAPLLFLFSQADTLALDRVTAETLAWRLRGQLVVVLICRDSLDVKTSMEYNAAYRLPGEGSEIKYFTLKSTEEVVDLFWEKMVQKEEEEDDYNDWTVLDVLDDEVVDTVYQYRDVELDLGPVSELTTHTFGAVVKGTNIIVVLFFVRWDALSMGLLQSFKEVANTLEGIPNMLLASVDCGEWVDLCGSEMVSSFPTIRTYRRWEPPQTYRGILGAEALHSYISRCHVALPVILFSENEVWSFLKEDIYHRYTSLSPGTVLGLLSSVQDPGRFMFEEAARVLRGETTLGLFVDDQAEKWAKNYGVQLPALFVCRGLDVPMETYSLHLSNTQELVADIQRALRGSFPELTVESLPLYLDVKKPLLLLFMGDDEKINKDQRVLENKDVRADLHSLIGTKQLDSYMLCWIHLGRTPVGRAVLQSYLGYIPQLPALVLSHLGSGIEVFLYPPEAPLMSDTVLQWLDRIDRQEEQPTGFILDKNWGPPVSFYNFLSIMDQQLPGYAAQRTPESTKRGMEAEHRDKQSGQTEQGARDTKHWPQEPSPHQHYEL